MAIGCSNEVLGWRQAEGEREMIRKALDETEAPTPVEIEQQRQQAEKC